MLQRSQESGIFFHLLDQIFLIVQHRRPTCQANEIILRVTKLFEWFALAIFRLVVKSENARRLIPIVAFEELLLKISESLGNLFLVRVTRDQVEDLISFSDQELTNLHVLDSVLVFDDRCLRDRFGKNVVINLNHSFAKSFDDF